LRRLENEADDMKRSREFPEIMALVNDVMDVPSLERDGDTVTPGANGGGNVCVLSQRERNDDRDA
jgi:hypothetical protein